MLNKLVEEKLTYQVIGVLYKVHNKLGPIYQEIYYQRAVEKELQQQGFEFHREYPVNIEYINEKIGEYKIDFLIGGKLVLETKAINKIHPKYIDQVLSYMNQLQVKVGLIANFKSDKLWIKRLLLPDKYVKKSVQISF